MRDITFRITCVVLIVLTITGFLFACSKKQEATKKNVAIQMSRGFECTANVNWDGKIYVVKIYRTAPGLCTMSFVKPDELSALSFVLDGDGFKVKYGSIEASLAPSSLPQTALFNSVLGALDTAVRPNDLNTRTKDGNIIISGKTVAGNFDLQLDGNYKPKSLKIPDLKLVLGFEGFTWLN
jgi:hypothetical protein